MVLYIYMIMRTVLIPDFGYFCAYLNSNASTCTSSFNSLDVADQGNNPAGMFNTTMLHIQAATQPYMVTDFVNMDDKNAALFVRLLPSRTIPDTDFTSIPIPTTTPSLTPSNPVESKRVCDATGAVSVTNTVYGLNLERLNCSRIAGLPAHRFR